MHVRYNTGPQVFGVTQSGSAQAPITYRSADVEKRAILSGGKHLPASAFLKVPGGSQYSVDLKTFGVTPSMLGTLAPGKLGECRQDISQVFQSGQPLLLARYVSGPMQIALQRSLMRTVHRRAALRRATQRIKPQHSVACSSKASFS